DSTSDYVGAAPVLSEVEEYRYMSGARKLRVCASRLPRRTENPRRALLFRPRRGFWAYAVRGTWLWKMISSTCSPDRLLLLRVFGAHTSTRISPAAVWRGTRHRGQNCHRQGLGNRL